jgi:regulator of sirC expression with transglutaminase-like and TPR domain
MYVEMISILLRRKLSSFLDKVAELRGAALELAGFIVWVYPIRDFALGGVSMVTCTRPRKRVAIPY